MAVFQILTIVLFLRLELINCKESCGDCLLVTPYIDVNNISAARQASVVGSDGLRGIKSFSGFVTVKKEFNSNLFYWFFPVPDEKLHDAPWIIWLQGGPGISSMLGLFELIGPIKIESGEVKLRNITWASNYSVVFVDNPVGAGYSFTDDDSGYPDNEDDVGEQLFEFLRQFLQMFPELRQAPLFIAGESYAGKYIPALGIQIHRKISNVEPMNFKGIIIGNGLIEPRSALHYSDICGVLGLVDEAKVKVVKQMEDKVIKLVDQNMIVDASNAFNETIEYIKKHSGVNIYNFNKDPSTTVPEFHDYIIRPDVRESIHVGNATFDYNNQVVYTKMLPDIMNTTKPWVEELLEHYGVMLYNGQLDVILGYGGARHLHQSLQWSGRDQYLRAPRNKLRITSGGGVVGYKKSGGNLVEVLIRGAGHMVPAEQPEVAKFVVDSFISQYS